MVELIFVFFQESINIFIDYFDRKCILGGFIGFFYYNSVYFLDERVIRVFSMCIVLVVKCICFFYILKIWRIIIEWGYRFIGFIINGFRFNFYLLIEFFKFIF